MKFFRPRSQNLREEKWWRLRRLKLTRAGEALGGQISVRPSLTVEELLRVWRFVHQRYVEVGLVPKEEPLWLTPYHFLPETRFFATYLGEKGPLSAAGIVFDSVKGLPSDALFQYCLEGLRRKGRRLVEFFSLASRPLMAARNTLFHLFRVLYRYALFCGATDIVIAIHPKHADFYEKILLFSRLGDRRHHFQFSAASFILEHLNLKEAPALYRRAYRDFPQEYNLYYFFSRERVPEENLFPQIKQAKINFLDFPVEIRNRDMVKEAALGA